jgi:hypothetical protein
MFLTPDPRSAFLVVALYVNFTAKAGRPVLAESLQPPPLSPDIMVTFVCSVL